MKFDDILINHVEEFGRYQKIQFVLLCLPTIFTALHALSWTFTGAVVNHRCLVIGENDTDDFPFIPPSDEYRKWLYGNQTDEVKNSCVRPIGVRVFDWTVSKNFSDNETESCKDGYKWDRSEIPNTAVMRWQIVCNDTWIRAFIQAVYYVGQFVGSFVFGILADKYGRKKIFFSAIILQIVCGSIMAYVPWWPLFAFFRFGLGIAHPGIFLIAVVIGMELVGPSRRVVAGVATGIFFAIGEIILGTLAYFIRDYQQLQLTISLPALVFIGYWWIVSESARWLISQRRFQEADEILQKVAKCNERKLPANWHEQIELDTKPTEKQVVKKYGFPDLFRTPTIRKRFIIASFVCWPTANLGFYSLSMNPNFLGGDRYVSFIVLATLEIPVLTAVLFTVNFVGRKALCVGGFIAGAVCILSTLFISKENPTANLVMVCLGKAAITSVYATLYVYTPEFFPTVIRSTAMGCCSMIARLGAVCASFLSMWLATVNTTAVVAIIGGLCVVAGFCTLFLPETAGQPQFDTIEEAENFGGNQPTKRNEVKRTDNSPESALLNSNKETKTV